jgi:tetratricopeptide (TPR) repeat protein
VADATRQVVYVVDAASGRTLRELPTAEPVWLRGVSPGGTWLAAVDASNRFYLWRTDTWEQAPPVQGKCVVFAPDDQALLAVETGEGRIRLLGPAGGEEVAVLADPNQDQVGYAALVFSQDGQRLFAGSYRANQAVHEWDLRGLREQLAELGLDWDRPAYGSVGRARTVKAVQLDVDPGPLPLAPKDAVVLYTAALALRPFNPVAHLRRAEALASQRKADEALADLDRAVAQAPGLAPAYALRSRLLHSRGQVREALPDWERLAELEPKNPTWPNSVAWTLLTGPPDLRDAPRALRLATRAVAVGGKDGLLLNTLGVAQYRNGLYREALGTLNASLALNRPRYAGNDLFFLAMCHQRLGEVAKAKECFDQATCWVALSALGAQGLGAQELWSFRAEAEQVLGLK